jgi:tetratricopeptide (TPR) repeat protein
VPNPSPYESYRNGLALIESGDHHAAVIALMAAHEADPDAPSVREALGRAYFGAHRYREAATEFEAVVERYPTNDYALFCLGRSLQVLGAHEAAVRPLALAACMQPDREDYRSYRDAARRLAA